jgi:hypothetical protein
MPNPNGYDDLVKAEEMLAKARRGITQVPGSNSLAEVVEAGAEAVRVAKIGLGRECRPPPRTSPVTYAQARSAPHRFYLLIGAFEDEGDLAEMRDHVADAAQSYLAVTRIGQEMTRGGGVRDAIFGSGYEEEGLTPLQRLATTFTSGECKQVTASLESADARRETVATVAHRERIWRRRAFGWRYYLHPIANAQQKDLASNISLVSDHTRKLMITLAARAFELEHGVKPKSINDLVPAYLKTIPKDAFTGKDMALGN